MTLPIDPVILILGSLFIFIFLLYLREYFLRKKASFYQKQFSEETRLKSLQFLKAAEQAEGQVIGESKFAAEKLQAEFKTQLENFIQASENSITETQNRLITFLEAQPKSTEIKVNQLFEKLETQLSDFLIQTEQKTTSSIDLELKSTRQLIDTYKAQQLKLIDENIIAMMEQTLNIVLGKKLSLKDQVDLVYEALERAKVDKFIV